MKLYEYRESQVAELNRFGSRSPCIPSITCNIDASVRVSSWRQFNRTVCPVIHFLRGCGGIPSREKEATAQRARHVERSEGIPL